MQKTIKVGIIGGAGYTGGELIRLLLGHPNVELTFIHSRSNAGAYLHEVHNDLLGETSLQFSSQIDQSVDVIFLCLGHGEAKAFLDANKIDDHIKIIDLSQDFRIKGKNNFIYAFPEFNKAEISKAHNLANPGCFATAIQLALLPLAHAGLLQQVHLTGITGATGAGQKLQSSSHFPWRSNNIQAYKSLDHQHMHEIRQTLSSFQKDLPAINFIPWRGDFTRGIYLSATTHFTASLEEAYKLYDSYYKDAAFTFISKKPVDLKQVVNTNKCIIHLEKQGDALIIHAAIDNLLKGASGQAVQNMNILFGLPEKTGLSLKATAF